MRNFVCPTSGENCADARCTGRYCVLDLDLDGIAAGREEARKESELRMILTAMARAASRDAGAPEPTTELIEKLILNPSARRAAEGLLIHGVGKISAVLKDQN